VGRTYRAVNTLRLVWVGSTHSFYFNRLKCCVYILPQTAPVFCFSEASYTQPRPLPLPLAFKTQQYIHADIRTYIHVWTRCLRAPDRNEASRRVTCTNTTPQLRQSVCPSETHYFTLRCAESYRAVSRWSGVKPHTHLEECCGFQTWSRSNRAVTWHQDVSVVCTIILSVILCLAIN
jgi:hypothetical protein